MRYDGSNALHAMQARAQLERLINGGCIFDINKKKQGRGIQANRYLHAIIAYLALELGEKAEYVKQKYYKELANPQTFVYEREDKYMGKTKCLRSSASLGSAEFSLTIDRFRNWAGAECGVYLPSPEEHRLVSLMEMEVERNRQHL